MNSLLKSEPFRIELNQGDVPYYRQLVERIRDAVRSGEIPAGARLPTVRELAEETGIARGTVKHAYDELEAMGLIEMTQGRGTFVKEQPSRPAGRKDRAMQAIDNLIGEMKRLGFTLGETRIFFDLKLREMEERSGRVRLGVVDCNPESMLSTSNQLSSMPNLEVLRIALEDALKSPAVLDGEYSLLLTTSKHYEDLERIIPSGARLMRIVMVTAPETIFELAKVPSDAKVGIITISERFADIVRTGCGSYCTLTHPPEIFLLGRGGDIAGFAGEKDVLILPSDYLGLCAMSEDKALSDLAAAGKHMIRYDYKIDRGSLLHLEEQLKRIRRK